MRPKPLMPDAYAHATSARSPTSRRAILSGGRRWEILVRLPCTALRRGIRWPGAGPRSSGVGFRPRPAPRSGAWFNRRGRSSSELPLRPAQRVPGSAVRPAAGAWPAAAGRPPSSPAAGNARPARAARASGAACAGGRSRAGRGRARSSRPCSLEPPYRPQLGVGGAARARQVGVVGVREPVRRALVADTTASSPRRKRRLLRAEEREQVGDRLDALHVRDGVPPALVDRARKALPLARAAARNVGRLRCPRPKLQVGVARPGHRARRQERAPEVGGAAAGARNHPPRRPLERREVRVENAGLVERLERAGIVLQVKLEAPRALERLPAGRCGSRRERRTSGGA